MRWEGGGLRYGNAGVNARTPGGLSCNFSTHAFRIPEMFAMRDVIGVASDLRTLFGCL